MKILVVDDEPVIADTLVNILNGEGHEALVFPTGSPPSSGREWSARMRL